MIKICAVILCLFSFGIEEGLSQQKGIHIGNAKLSNKDRRMALVIGNAAYQGGFNVLNNTERDADSMSVVLETLGFKVSKYKNLDKINMTEVFLRFENSLQKNDVVVVYFSGHGIGHGSKNYLLPTDAQINCLGELKNYDKLSLGIILDGLEKVAIKNCFIFLDACRNSGYLLDCSDLREKGGNVPSGLSIPNSNPEGSYIVFATQAGKTANDDAYNKVNSLFTGELIRFLRVPNWSHRKIIDETAKSVKSISNQSQKPEKYDNIDGDYFFLVDDGSIKNKTLSPTERPSPKPPTKPQNGIAKKDWEYAPYITFIEGGVFSMGGNDGEENEKPVHQVSLKNYWIGKYEVTVSEYMTFVEETNSHFPEWLEKGNSYYINSEGGNYYSNKGYTGPRSNLPIVGINWDDATAYCEWLSKKTTQNYRLPTEAEWEFAANGGNKSSGYKFSGSNEINDVGWVGENSNNKIHQVGSKKPNSLEIHDLTGNVWEWCADWFAPYTNSYQTNPLNLMGDKRFRVVRGGAFSYSKDYSRNTFRSPVEPSTKYDFTGFRVVRE
jgi:formylglycine-generating enzyme required for sulfatase activity